ncbi:MAG: enoyl-CoA hydratase/isomerase family protein [Candidatus Binataceae bacterium]
MHVHIDGHVAHLTLNRPDAANALNLELAEELNAVAHRLSRDSKVRAVLLSGAGRMFCAGGDLKSFAAQPPDELGHYLERVTLSLHNAISTFARMNAPVIAAVHGSAAGAGFSLVCACDFVVAAETSRFTMAYTRVGLTPDGSSTYFLPRIVGFRRALELAVLNPVLSAAEAKELGIVTRVVPDAELMTAAASLAMELASGATLAIGATKRLLSASATNTLESQMALETFTISSISASSDAREGMGAFIAKRPPKFTGE